MSNSLTVSKGEAWANMLQETLYPDVLGFQIANTKFEGEFSAGNDTVNFQYHTNINSSDYASPYAPVTIENVTLTNETMALDYRKQFNWEMAGEDLKEMRVDPKSDLMRNMKEEFAQDYDDQILAQHANATYTVDDGNLTTATNGGAGNPAILTKSNVYEFFLACRTVMNQNNIPQKDRFLIVDPLDDALMLQDNTYLIRSTGMGDNLVQSGVVGTLGGIKIYYSNRLATASNIRHSLSGAGKPIAFAANVRPSVQIVSSSVRENHANLMKAYTKFGVKTFLEGANKLIDVNVYEA